MKKCIKYLFIVFPLLLFSVKTNAQDVIVLKDGSSILSKVLEVTTSEVKYKKWANLDGPTYTSSTAEILSINYQNGEKESLPTTTTEKMSGICVNESSLYNPTPDHAKKQMAKGMNVAGNIIGLGGFLGCLATGILLHANGSVDTDVSLWIGLGGGFACLMLGGAISNRANKLLESTSLIRETNLYRHEFKLGDSTLSSELDLLTDSYTRESTLGIGFKYCF